LIQRRAERVQARRREAGGPVADLRSEERRGGTGMASEGLHEERSDLSEETRDMHRAIVSLMEELEAVDWYNQRADAARDEELKAILVHNRDEEKEHASMLLEWVRRKDRVFDRELRDTLFKDEPITGLESEHRE
jgi:ferritin-like protein